LNQLNKGAKHGKTNSSIFGSGWFIGIHERGIGKPDM
jgi:hypothetical protein